MWQATRSGACLRTIGACRVVQKKQFLATQGQGFLRLLAGNQDDQNVETQSEVRPQSLQNDFVQSPVDRTDRTPSPRHCAPAESLDAWAGATARVIVGLRSIRDRTWMKIVDCETLPAPETSWAPATRKFGAVCVPSWAAEVFSDL